MNAQENVRRKHDGFLKFAYSNPENTRALLQLSETTDKNLADMLAEVDLETLVEVPEAYNEVGEYGEADLAFKVKGIGGEDVFFGILLEHKSSPTNNIFSQIYRYTYQVMVNKDDKEFAWMPTKAIIIYNGTMEWDPLANFRKKQRARFQGKLLPFECAFVNLAKINDKDCLESDNVEASVGVLTLKYAFNVKKFKELLPDIEKKLSLLSRERASTFVEKIELYLGEYISQTSLEELKMAFQSIGQRLGFVSAGDERRAAIKVACIAARKEALDEARKEIAAREAFHAAREAALKSEKDALKSEKAALKSEKAALESEKAELLKENFAKDALIRELEAALALKR